jgi:hypothetical protein
MLADGYEEERGAIRQKWIDEVKAQGYRVIEPKDDELFIDIDTVGQLATFERNWPIFERDITAWFGEAPVYEKRVSDSGEPHVHIIVKLPFEIVGTDSNFERIAWQAALGSDPTRELISAFRVTRNTPYPIAFKEKR